LNTYIVLLRGINVGGKNLLPMKELKALLIVNGFENVQTYIQSGNIVLMGAKNPGSVIGSLIQKEYGFTPEIIVLTKREFESSVSNNPYQKFEGKFVHFYFCQEAPKLNATKLVELTAESESHKLAGNVFYLHAPNGIGRSKLVSRIETCLGVPATGRNLNSINKLKDMLENV
jgi:uncharacterized protein (DUF1697 family)